MKTIITALFFAFAFASCDKESYNEELPSYVRENRNDAPPSNFKGEWTCTCDKSEIIMSLSDTSLVLNLEKYGRGKIVVDLTDEALYKANIENRLYTVERDGMSINLSNGLGDYEKFVTLTIDNDCITRMMLFIPPVVDPVEPEQPEQPAEPTEPEPSVNVN
jgi:hypothetical protein